MTSKSQTRDSNMVQYGNSTHVGDGCRQQHCIENCSQTAAACYFWQPIGSRHRSIQQYHCRTVCCLAKIHALWTDRRHIKAWP